MISNILGSACNERADLREQYVSDMYVHSSCGEELSSGEVSFSRPSLTTVGVVFEGELCVGDAANWHKFDVRENNSGAQKCAGFIMNTTNSQILRRRFVKGNRFSKIAVSMPSGALHQKLVRSRRSNPQVNALLTKDNLFEVMPTSELTKERAEHLFDYLQFKDDLLELEARSLALISSFVTDLSRFASSGFEPVKERQQAIDKYRECDVQESDRVLAFIEAQFENGDPRSNLSLAAISESLAMSQSKIQRDFSKRYGKTVNDYIRSRRLGFARQQLLNKKMSIGEVAYLAGYNHTSNFTIAFKKVFGVTPGELKAQAL